MDVGGMSPGTQLNRFMDGMGFPDKLGDMYGIALDKAIGNDLGVARNMLDLFSPLKTSQLDRMMSGGFAGPGQIPRPHDNYGHHWGVSKHTHYEREQINVYKEPGLMGMFGKKDVMIDCKNVDVGNDWGVNPKQLEAKILTDPNFRAKIEGQVGGRIVLDGNADGNITIAKKVPHPMMPFHNHCHSHVGNMLGRMVPGMMNGVLGQLGNVLGGIGGLAQGIGQGIGQAVGGILGGQQGTQGTQQGGVGGAQGQGGPDELSQILKNPNLSFEAKLAQFMMKFMEKKQKEIEGKMEQMKSQQESGKEGAGGAGKAGGGGGGKGGGLLGGILGGGGGLVGGLLGGGGGGGLLGGILGGGGGGGLGGILQMGGGLLGGMYGGPLGASMGSAIGGAAGGILGGGGGGQAGQAGQGAGGAGGAGGGKGSEQIAMKELETMMQAFQRMMESMGNVLKSVHDMSMSSARLIR